MNESSFTKLKDKLVKVELIVTSHARIRMFEINISIDDAKHMIKHGELLETYDDDFPCPSLLILVTNLKRKLHIVVGNCENHIRMITIYIPDNNLWENYRLRKGN